MVNRTLLGKVRPRPLAVISLSAMVTRQAARTILTKASHTTTIITTQGRHTFLSCHSTAAWAITDHQ